MKRDAADIFVFTIRRIGASAVLLACLLTLVFALAHLAPGDPVTASLSPSIPSAAADKMREHLGLDRSFLSQYLSWLGSCLRGNLGVSITYHRAVIQLVGLFLPNTVLLACSAIAIEFAAGVLFGMIAAGHQHGWVDRIVSQASVALCAVPSFWIGVVLVGVFSYGLGLVPSSQMFATGVEEFSSGERVVDLCRHLILPALTIAIPGCAAVARYVRANLVSLQNEEYLLYARSYGVASVRRLIRYDLANTIGPIITLLGLEAGTLLAGALVTETIFSWPGMGRLTVGAILARDYPLVMGCTTVAGVAVIAGNFVADVLHAVADPRVRVVR